MCQFIIANFLPYKVPYNYLEVKSIENIGIVTLHKYKNYWKLK